MLPADRLAQSQEILISKLLKYLDLVKKQAISIDNEDIEKLLSQIEKEKLFSKEIAVLDKVVRGICKDLKDNSLFSDSVKLDYEEKRKKCINLSAEIDGIISLNSEKLINLKSVYKDKIDAAKSAVSKEIKILNSSQFSLKSEFLDFKV